MFTGMVEAMGDVLTVEGARDFRRLAIRSPQVTPELPVGGSIAVDGVCLTVVEIHGDRFCGEVGAETLRRTTLGTLTAGKRVNLERPLRLASRLDGHLVQGHVDGMGAIVRMLPEGKTSWAEIRIPQNMRRYLVEKGSVAVDGVSLTVAGVTDEGVAVSLIPHTLSRTTLGSKRAGDPVHSEVDVVAKYVERLAAAHFEVARGRADVRSV